MKPIGGASVVSNQTTNEDAFNEHIGQHKISELNQVSSCLSDAGMF